MRTIISKDFISLILNNEEGYRCCAIPRCDANLLSESIILAKDVGNVMFETAIMNIEVSKLDDKTCAIECTHKKDPSISFNFVCNLKEIILKIKAAIETGIIEFDKAIQRADCWGFFTATL